MDRTQVLIRLAKLTAIAASSEGSVGELAKAIQTLITTGSVSGCGHIHAADCLKNYLTQTIGLFKGSYKLFLILNIVPVLLVMKGQVKTHPKVALKKIAEGFLRSMAFVCVFAFVPRLAWCALVRGGKLHLGSYMSVLAISSLGIFFLPDARWSDLAMMFFPRLVESLTTFLGKRKLIPNLPYGLNFMFATAFAIIGHCFFEDPDSIKATMRFPLTVLLGRSNENKHQ